MNIGTITCSYFMRIYGYKKPEDFNWGAMTEKYRTEFTRQDFLKLAEEIRALGYDSIEIWEPTFSHFVYTPEEAASLAEELKAMGFQLIAYCIGGWGPADIEHVETAYAFAKALGARVVTGCILREGTEALLAEVERCGKKYGLKYAIENHPEPNFERPEDVAETIRKYDTIGANLDSGIYNMQGYDILAAADLFGDKIYHVHYKDTVTGKDGCLPLGAGNAPLAQLLHKLQERSYGEMLSVEFEFAGDPAPGLAESLAFIQKNLI